VPNGEVSQSAAANAVPGEQSAAIVDELRPFERSLDARNVTPSLLPSYLIVYKGGLEEVQISFVELTPNGSRATIVAIRNEEH